MKTDGLNINIKKMIYWKAYDYLTWSSSDRKVLANPQL